MWLFDKIFGARSCLGDEEIEGIAVNKYRDENSYQILIRISAGSLSKTSKDSNGAVAFRFRNIFL